ncbi:MAG: response regulator [Bdellovibrionales bacterium]|nr:response regulator [Bdellovibrionales bacterium]
MSFDTAYRKASSTPVLTTAERRKISILIVDSDANVRQTMRQSLTGLGFGAVSDAPDHALALTKIEERPISHIIFEARNSKMPAKEFMRRVFELDSGIVALASSYEPTVDDVFDLLINGARGYIVKPFNTEGLDQSLVMATKGEPISESVLNAKNRNEALAALMMASLDKLATIMRQATHFETARRELPIKASSFRRAVDLGYTFAKGGPLMLRETLIELCIERSRGPATRLGRYRKRLEKRKGNKEGQELEESVLEDEGESTIPGDD